MNWRMMKIVCGWICDEVRMGFDNCEGKPVPNDLVASGGMRCTGSAGNDFGNVQHGST